MIVNNFKKGSALLIVLGMLSFLIISAVAFSAYMRSSRLPSSFLRRNSSNRLLVKAAMAEAIDYLDRAINNNPHPGVGDDKFVDSLTNQEVFNTWTNRVLIGEDFNVWCESETNWVETISPLCYEALAYIPPPLVNDIRYYSRQTPTAKWKSFDFDVGRYAFCVVDVSDYFDVNRMFASERRSSAPNQRVSLSYLFEEGAEHTGSGSGGSTWDTFLEEFRKVDSNTKEITFDSKYPLISIADLNLALGSNGEAYFKSPFFEFHNTEKTAFYSGLDLDKVSRMTFVTDGLFLGNTQTNKYDITDVKNQPFVFKEGGENPKPPMDEIFQSKEFAKEAVQEVKNEWAFRLGAVGNVCLYDYLDFDQKPLSLALPTVERFPMICGIKPELNFELFIRRDVSEEKITQSESGSSREIEQTVIYKFDADKIKEALDDKINVNALTVFPFAHIEQPKSFTIDGRLSVFFSEQLSEDDSNNVALRTEGDDIFVLKKDLNQEVDDGCKNGIINILLNSTKPYMTSPSMEQLQALKSHDLGTTDLENSIDKFFKSYEELLSVTFKWTQHKSENGAWTPSLQEVISNVNNGEIDKIIKSYSRLPVLKADATKSEKFTNEEELKSLIVSSGTTINLKCAIWLRIKDEDEYVVDLVPACIADDKNLNDIGWNPYMDVGIDRDYPLLRFDTTVEFKFSLRDFEEKLGSMTSGSDSVSLASGSLTDELKSIMVADPRYNYAPENWFKFDGLNENTWLAWVKDKLLKKDNRDSDIFMETSDSGYMQSIYELAFLPRTKPLDVKDDEPKDMSYDKTRKLKIAGSFEETCYKNVAWRTYNPFKDGDKGDKTAFKDLKFNSEGNGFKVNPYTDSKNIMMAAFANTPIGWRYSSTNKVEDVMEDLSKIKMEDFNKKYAYNAYSDNDNSKVAWDDLESVASEFMAQMRKPENSQKDWEDVFADDMGWDNTPEGELPGMVNKSETQQVKFWGVDKKFLYGFWKDCFAVKQQLFLVFVRTEPMMMGSGSTTLSPPQLGGRAMALVWRDPAKTGDDEIPHKTRVLFYRQFE